MRWLQLCSSLNILWHCFSLGLEWKLAFPSPMATVRFPNLLADWVQHFHSIIFQDLKRLNWNSITSTSFVGLRKHSFVYMYHILDPFLYWWWFRLLLCLGIVNSATVNVGRSISFELWFSLDTCPGVGLLGRMVVLYLVFQGTPILFSLVVVPIYTPPTV